MPGKTLSPYEQVPVTKEDRTFSHVDATFDISDLRIVDWAELIELDLSQFEKPGGKESLVKQLEHAVRHVGFFYVKNFNISQEEVDRQFALGREFYDLPLEEKLKHHSIKDLESGEYNGYRPAGLRSLAPGITDNIQVYNIPKFDGHHERKHPAVLQDHIKEIETFSRKCHSEVVVKLLKLFALLLRVDEDFFVKDHAYDDFGEDHLRYMHYAARSAEENAKVGELYTPGHTDLGSVTLLFRQPVAALQILNNEGQWKWVKPQDATITINTCDALTALTAGYVKSSVHRVRAPPKDQAHVDRLGVLYFARPNNHVLLDPIKSPVLESLGLTSNAFTQLGQHLTMQEWVKLRQTQQQRKTETPEIKEGKYFYKPKDLEILPGLTATVHN
ncbi:Clavaminate synthase-like protein [Aureobasidium subglaciale]|nr:Clavaminate synthase-like protein [Aureobasidium subglaciale]